MADLDPHCLQGNPDLCSEKKNTKIFLDTQSTDLCFRTDRPTDDAKTISRLRLRIMTGIDLVNIYAYIKLSEILSFIAQGIERQ